MGDQRAVGLLLRAVIRHPEIQHVPGHPEVAGAPRVVGRGRRAQRFPPGPHRPARRGLGIAARGRAVARGQRRQQAEPGHLGLPEREVVLHRPHPGIEIAQQGVGHRPVHGERAVERRPVGLQPGPVGRDAKRRLLRRQGRRRDRAAGERRSAQTVPTASARASPPRTRRFPGSPAPRIDPVACLIPRATTGRSSR